MIRILKVGLLLSIGLHLLILMLLSLRWSPKNQPIPRVVRQEIELIQSQTLKAKKTRSSKLSKQQDRIRKSLSFTRFGTHLFELSKTSHFQFGGSFNGSRSQSSNGIAVGSYGDGESLQGLLIRGRPMEDLAKLIINSLSYHQILIDNNVEGKVRINLEVTPKLKLVRWKKPTGTNEILSAFVLVNLIAIFGKETLVNESLKSDVNNLKIHLDFSFKTQFNFPGISTKNYEIIDPGIYFKFVSYREPNVFRWINENLPVVPIPGGILINVIAIAKIIEDWDKVDPDIRRKQLYQHFSEDLINKASK